MTGAECLLRTLLAHGIDTCFMNPGTSEMQFVSALDRVDGMRGVLCLQESVCAGAADGYARMTRRPAATLLHLGPGLANALSNFHNARKARSPVVNIVGEHATHHLAYDAPLTADVEAFARPVSAWVRTLAAAKAMGEAAAEAVAAAMAPPGGIASLLIPADYSWSESGAPGTPVPPMAAALPASEAIREAARLLRAGGALLLGGAALLEPALVAVARIHAATGARVFANRYAPRLPRGSGVFPVTRIPYFPEPAQALLEGIASMVLAHAEPPVSFFGYPNSRSTLAPPGCQFHTLASETENAAAALAALADELHAPATTPVPYAPLPDCPRDGGLTPDTIGMALAAMLPEGAVLADEMVSAGEAVNSHLNAARAHDLLPVTGGSIGQGLPVALGAAIACPERKVVALEADGSGMYSLQALWTMARERLDVLTIVFANRRYRILEVEMERTGAGPVGPRASRMIDIADPPLDWVALALGHGIEAARAETLASFVDVLSTGLARRGPFLIEAQI